jgi:hypothetical protein
VTFQPKDKTILAGSHIAVTLLCIEARQEYDSLPETLLPGATVGPTQAEVDQYIRLVRNRTIPVTGKTWDVHDYPDELGVSSRHWKWWWNFIHPQIVMDNVKPLGVWSLDDGAHVGRDALTEKLELDANPFKKSKLTNSKKLMVMQGNCWMSNPILVFPVTPALKFYEERRTYRTGDSSKLEKKSTISWLEPTSKIGAQERYEVDRMTIEDNVYQIHRSGRITCYYLVHPDKKYVYLEFACEKYHGERFKKAADYQFQYYRRIGIVREMPSRNYPVERLDVVIDEHAKRSRDFTGETPDRKAVLESYKTYSRQAAWVDVFVYF